ncbi:MAG: RNA polymerase sporulation sigma factor SigK [Bacillota bacterium]|nr:RNA polymerase sporulation sigma factor SigK [Bacillota bacterium]
MFTVLATVALVLKGILLLVSYITNDSFPQPLTTKEEKKYLKLLSNGDEDARQVLIERNLRLVAHVVKKFESLPEDKEDLISIGTIGLIKAINTFDSTKGARLATYAAKCVENEILMHIRARKKNRQEVSIHEPIGVDKDGNEICLEDILGSSPEGVLDEVELILLNEKLKRVIKKLQARERKVLIMRYGLEGKKRYTQKDVAGELGISRSYVSRIEKKILFKIAEEFELEGYRQ